MLISTIVPLVYFGGKIYKELSVYYMMFVVLKEGKLREIVAKALGKAGNIRKLEKEIKIPRSTLSAYYNEKRVINGVNLDKFTSYSKIRYSKKDVLEELPFNWRQIKGGLSSVKSKRKRGTFYRQLNLCHKSSSSYMKSWHKKMKKNNPEKYYRMQFDKFRKVGSYKYTTKKGDKVRNSLERDVANILWRNKLNYEYEPFIRVADKAFFPDFLVNGKLIIECTMWRHSDKAVKLKNKIKYLRKRYKIYIIIPKDLYRHYLLVSKYLLKGVGEFEEILKKDL